MNPELRQNKITGEWVVYSGARGLRPHDYDHSQRRKHKNPKRDASCPFCPGNEIKTPGPVFETKTGSGKWQTRVFLNKYPAFVDGEERTVMTDGFFRSISAFGRHEVLVDHPAHNQDICKMPVGDLEKVIQTYHCRHADAFSNPDIQAVVLFRNHGPRAGTSLKHPHSQLIAVPVVPKHLEIKESAEAGYFRDTGKCIYCDIAEFERNDGERMVAENECFLAFVPFFAEVPCETWILPKKHEPDFSKLTGVEQRVLAGMLRDILLKLRILWGDPDYNYVVVSPSRKWLRSAESHWFLMVRPRLVIRAGFEIGSGMRINPSLPERDAEALRNAKENP